MLPDLPAVAAFTPAISFDVKERTSTLVFNSSGLDLRDAVIYSEAVETKEQVPHSQNFDETSERFTLQFSVPLPAGSKAQLRVSFRGDLTGSLLGYYKSSWENHGKKKYYALTQFEVISRFLSINSHSFYLTITAYSGQKGFSLLGRAIAQGNVCH
jgi:aminopeptidase N